MWRVCDSLRVVPRVPAFAQTLPSKFRPPAAAIIERITRGVVEGPQLRTAVKAVGSISARSLEIRVVAVERPPRRDPRGASLKRIRARRSSPRRTASKTADNERYRATRNVNIYARINAILSHPVRSLTHTCAPTNTLSLSLSPAPLLFLFLPRCFILLHLAEPDDRCPKRTIRAARASDRRKRRSIWRERPRGMEERGGSAVGTMRWMHSAMHYSASVVVADGFHCDPEHVRHCMQMLYVNASVSRSGNVEGNNPSVPCARERSRCY